MMMSAHMFDAGPEAIIRGRLMREADLICPVWLDEYELLEFDVNPITLEHRGIFRCGCGDMYLFPEELTLEMIEDADIRDRLRISRMLHIGKSLAEMKARSFTTTKTAAKAETRSLIRYIEDVSAQSIRSLTKR